MLDLVEACLNRKGYKYARLDGSMSQKQREFALKNFSEPDFTVMVISMRAGGVGLNLTTASHVFLMDPWW